MVAQRSKVIFSYEGRVQNIMQVARGLVIFAFSEKPNCWTVNSCDGFSKSAEIYVLYLLSIPTEF